MTDQPTLDLPDDVAFWTAEGDGTETLYHTTIAEAVVARCEYDRGNPLRPIPEMMKVEGWSRMAGPTVDVIADRALDQVLDDLMNDDCMTDPDGGELKATPGQIAASRVFAEAFLKEFTVWGCEPVTSQVVRVADFYPASPSGSETR